MRCPYCQQNIRVQGRFCPKCGEQIFGLPVRPQQPATPPEGAAPTPPAPPQPAPPPYQPFPTPQPPPPDLADGLGIEVEEGPADRVGALVPDARAPEDRRAYAPGAPHPATTPEIGKTCPYCRFPIKPGEQVVMCPACNLPHHADCWRENQGCTTYGCRGGAAVAGPTPAVRGPIGPSVLSPTGGTPPSLDYLQANELSARANNALILAIVGLCGCLPLGVVGLFMAFAVMADISRLRSRAADARGKATAAIVIGIIGVIGWVIALIVTLANPQVQ
jgi:hypothetical protein